ncbi:MAG: hypothetical protein RR851_04890 [Clostridium sp.]
MKQIKLLIIKVIANNLLGKFKIASIYISYDELVNSPNDNDINIKKYNGMIFENYGNGLNKFYTIKNSTTTSCEINFNLGKELDIEDKISITLTKEVLTALNNPIPAYGTITVSLFTIFNNIGYSDSPIYYEMPSSPGIYQVQLLEINETDISDNDIKSLGIKVVNAPDTAIIPKQPYIENTSSYPVTFQILDTKDTNNNLVTANFTTILRVKVIQ